MLHVAASNGHLALLTWLCEEGCDAELDARDAQLNTPLHLAAQHLHLDVCRMLVQQGAHVFARNADHATPSRLVRSLRDDERQQAMLRFLAEAEAHSLDTAQQLFDAAERGDTWQLQALLRGPGIQHLLDWMNPAVDDATALLVAAANGHREVCEMLLAAGADVNWRNGSGETALLLAACANFPSVCALLLRREVQVDAVTEDGDTALHCVAALSDAQLDVCRLLLEGGASGSTVDARRNLPLHLAAHNGNAALTALLLPVTPDINACNSIGDTALHLASAGGHVDVCRVLLDAAATVTSRNHARLSPLDVALFSYRGATSHRAARLAAIQALLGGPTMAGAARMQRVTHRDGSPISASPSHEWTLSAGPAGASQRPNATPPYKTPLSPVQSAPEDRAREIPKLKLAALTGVSDGVLIVALSSLVPVQRLSTSAHKLVFESRCAAQRCVVVVFPTAHSPAQHHRFHSHLHLLSDAAHPNVVRLIAAVTSDKLALVYKLELGSSLSSFLRQQTPSWPLAPRLKLVLDVAEGLRFLHARSLFHRNLKPANVELDQTRSTAMIADLMVFPDQRVTFSAWSAPEVMVAVTTGAPQLASLPGAAGDMYAFGWICFEVLTLQTPFSEVTSAVQLLTKVVMQGERKPLVAMPPEMRELISDCWSPDAEARPSAAQACDVVKRLAQAAAR